MSEHSHGGARRGFGPLRRAAVAIAALALSGAGWAASISYTATDVADATPGQDRWQYSYQLQGPIDPGATFVLTYGNASYADLQLLTSPLPANLDVPPLTQPDPLLPADGLVYITDFTGAGGDLVVEFTWLGTGTPGAQSFDLVDANGNPVSTSSTVAAGTTPVPEPGMAWLLGACAFAALAAGRRTRRLPAG